MSVIGEFSLTLINISVCGHAYSKCLYNSVLEHFCVPYVPSPQNHWKNNFERRSAVFKKSTLHCKCPLLKVGTLLRCSSIVLYKFLIVLWTGDILRCDRFWDTKYIQTHNKCDWWWITSLDIGESNLGDSHKFQWGPTSTDSGQQ